MRRVRATPRLSPACRSKPAPCDAAVGAFVLVADNLDMAVENLASRVPTPYSAWLAAAQTGLEQAYTHLREAVMCSAVDFRQPGNGKQVLPCASATRSCRIAHGPPRTLRPPTRPGSPGLASRRTQSSKQSSRTRVRHRAGWRVFRTGHRFSPGKAAQPDGHRENHRSALEQEKGDARSGRQRTCPPSAPSSSAAAGSPTRWPGKANGDGSASRSCRPGCGKCSPCRSPRADLLARDTWPYRL